MNRKTPAALLLFLALAPATATLEAQAYGRLVLTLKDAQGAALAGVQVVVTCPEQPSFRLEEKSNRKGMVTLAFGDATRDYILRVEHPGYAPIETDFKPHRASRYPSRQRARPSLLRPAGLPARESCRRPTGPSTRGSKRCGRKTWRPARPSFWRS